MADTAFIIFLFQVVLLLRFVWANSWQYYRYIFRTLYSWWHCSYISYAMSMDVAYKILTQFVIYSVFIVALLLYFVRYVHGYMKSFPVIKTSGPTVEWRLYRNMFNVNTTNAMRFIPYLLKVFCNGLQHIKCLWRYLYSKANKIAAHVSLIISIRKRQ